MMGPNHPSKVSLRLNLPGGIPVMTRPAPSERGTFFMQASGIWEGKGFTNWSIQKGSKKSVVLVCKKLAQMG